VNPTVTTSTLLPAVWFVLAGWEEEAKTWCGVEFGLGEYDAGVFVMDEARPCYPPTGGLELPTAGWPGPGEGTASVVTGDPWQGNWIPVYVFGGYAYGYGGASTLIPIAADPATGFAGLTNCTHPPEAFEFDPGQLGALGANTPGTVPAFPPPPQPAACCVMEVCTLRFERECQEGGGLWMEGVTSCEPNPCPHIGVCCVGGIGVLLEEDLCRRIGGRFIHTHT
jgi:hypothetical protein